MLAKASYQPFGEVLELLDAYADEDNESVWGIISLVVSEARRFIDLDESLEATIKQFIGSLIQKQYVRLGWEERENESASDQKLRATIIALGVYAEDKDVLAEAVRRFAAYQQNASSLNPELRSIVMGAAVRHGVQSVMAELLKLHDSTSNADLRSDICAALTVTERAGDATALLDRLTDPKLIKPQDADYWLFYLIRNRHTRAIAWDWMVAHWSWVMETYSGDKSYDDFPRYTASACNTKAWADKYEAFFAPKQSDITLKRNIQVALSEIQTRVRWLQRDLASMQAFFRHQ